MWNPYLEVEETINVTLDRIYHRQKINPLISKNEMQELLLLGTKYFHFCFDSDIYQQCNCVAMTPS